MYLLCLVHSVPCPGIFLSLKTTCCTPEILGSAQVLSIGEKLRYNYHHPAGLSNRGNIPSSASRCRKLFCLARWLGVYMKSWGFRRYEVCVVAEIKPSSSSSSSGRLGKSANIPGKLSLLWWVHSGQFPEIFLPQQTTWFIPEIFGSAQMGSIGFIMEHERHHHPEDWTYQGNVTSSASSCPFCRFCSAGIFLSR